MIYLIHGQNQVDSRRFLIRVKSTYQDIQQIPGKGLSDKIFKEVLSRVSYPLFGGKTALLIEGFDGNWQIFPKKLPEGVDLILWSEEKVAAGDFPAKKFLFDQVKKTTSFKLADAILFRNERQALVLATQILDTKEPSERIIGALSRSFALVYAAKEGSLQYASLADFAREKIKEQAGLWSKASLKKGLLQLLLADIGIKEGEKAHFVFTRLISRLATF
jgi:hypothetical protein